MKYDDGFVAYLNGTEIARGNAPSDVNWRSTAIGSRDDDAAVKWQSFEFESSENLLRNGKNLLAIHGLNRSLGSSDALWHAELVRVDRSDSRPTQTALEYKEPIGISKRTTINAAVFANYRWSPIASATFLPGIEPASSQNLVISEMDYKPTLPDAPNGFVDPDAYEFVRLKNVGKKPVALHGLRFIEGIRCRIDKNTALLPVNESAVVVKHRAAFESRYGGDERIVGKYDGSLSDKGETLTLIDQQGSPIVSVAYEEKIGQ